MTDDKSVFRKLESAGSSVRRVRLRGASSEDATAQCGPYEVLGRLAEGGVGEVWRGRDMDIGRDVALKFLRQGFVDNPEIVQRFVDEAQIAGQLQHPGVVPVYQLGLRENKQPYIAMKLVKGKTFAALLRGQKTGQRKRLEIFEQICRAVAYAHERGVIHRDLKPSNVMVGAFGEVQVLDWGFAKVLSRGGVADERAQRQDEEVTRIATRRSGSGSDPESQAGSIMGTPAYMPPEQALGQVDALDERSDVFALGAILCELLTGKPPYDGAHSDVFIQAAQAQLKDAHARLDECDADADLVDLARRCLAPLRGERPTDAGEVGDAVLRHLSAIEERAHRAELSALRASERAERAELVAVEQRRARKQSVLLAATILCVLLLGGGGYVLFDQRKQARIEEARVAVGQTLGDAEQALDRRDWPRAMAAAEKAVALSRDGDDALRSRADNVLAEIHTAQKEQAARRAQRNREQKLLETIEEARLARAKDYGTKGFDAAMTALLKKHGIDISAPEHAARVIQSRWPGIRVQLAGALDEWAWLRAERNEDAQHLVAIANRIDGNKARRQLRAAVQTHDRASLRRLGQQAKDRRNLSVRTLDLLALALDKSGESERAIELAYRAWNKDPSDFWAAVHLSRFLSGAGRALDSVRFLEAAVALRPSSAYSWHLLAHSCATAGLHERAGIAFRRARELAPETMRHGLCHSEFLSERGEHAAALALLRGLIDAHPKEARAHVEAGWALIRKRDFKAAEQAARKAIACDPAHAPAYAALSRALLLQGKATDALVAADEAVRLDPKFVRGHHERGATLYKLGRLEGAIKAHREAVRVEPTAPSLASLGNALVDKGDLAGAIEACRKAIRFGPGHVDAHINYAYVLSVGKQYHRAAAAAREAVRLAPTRVEAHVNLASTRLHLGNLSGALQAAETAVSIQPGFYNARIVLANVLDVRGDRAGAEKHLREAIKIRPELPRPYWLLCNVFGATGRFGEASDAIRTAYELLSRQPNTRHVRRRAGGQALGELRSDREGPPATRGEQDHAQGREPVPHDRLDARQQGAPRRSRALLRGVSRAATAGCRSVLQPRGPQRRAGEHARVARTRPPVAREDARQGEDAAGIAAQDADGVAARSEADRRARPNRRASGRRARRLAAVLAGGRLDTCGCKVTPHPPESPRARFEDDVLDGHSRRRRRLGAGPRGVLAPPTSTSSAATSPRAGARPHWWARSKMRCRTCSWTASAPTARWVESIPRGRAASAPFCTAWCVTSRNASSGRARRPAPRCPTTTTNPPTSLRWRPNSTARMRPPSWSWRAACRRSVHKTTDRTPSAASSCCGCASRTAWLSARLQNRGARTRRGCTMSTRRRARSSARRCATWSPSTWPANPARSRPRPSV